MTNGGPTSATHLQRRRRTRYQASAVPKIPQRFQDEHFNIYDRSYGKSSLKAPFTHPFSSPLLTSTSTAANHHRQSRFHSVLLSVEVSVGSGAQQTLHHYWKTCIQGVFIQKLGAEPPAYAETRLSCASDTCQ